MEIRKQEVIDLLQALIRSPSFSGQEAETARLIRQFLEKKGLEVSQSGNNIIATYTGAGTGQPYILLCSHHDTVKPNASYARDPFSPDIEGDHLYGLGANDAGASLVSLIFVFASLALQQRKINLVLAAVAEEEISGTNGVVSILETLPPVELAIVGEPTRMQLAVAEKGLLVIDGFYKGLPGHAAHDNTVNPIPAVCQDVLAIQNYTFDRISPYLGNTKARVTVIHAGELHNQVPAECRFVVDCRVNEMYTLEEVHTLLQGEVQSELMPRSLRLKPTGIDPNHKIIRIAEQLSIPTFGSATLSDQALIPFPSVKIGPGDSLRSHTADEFVCISEIEEGIDRYLQLIEAYIHHS